MRKELEAKMRILADLLHRKLRGAGFILMIFNFEGEQFCAYASNADRKDCIRLLREQADRMEHGTDNTIGES